MKDDIIVSKLEILVFHSPLRILDIDEVCCAALRRAKRYKKPILFSFNDITLCASTYSSIDSLIMDYFIHIADTENGARSLYKTFMERKLKVHI